MEKNYDAPNYFYIEFILSYEIDYNVKLYIEQLNDLNFSFICKQEIKSIIYNF